MHIFTNICGYVYADVCIYIQILLVMHIKCNRWQQVDNSSKLRLLAIYCGSKANRRSKEDIKTRKQMRNDMPLKCVKHIY